MSVPDSISRTTCLQRHDPAVRAIARNVLRLLLSVVGAILIAVGALVALASRARGRRERPRLLWGVQPIISLVNLSRAMRRRATRARPSRFLRLGSTRRAVRSSALPDDRQCGRAVRRPLSCAPTCFFARALRRYDVFHYFFDGGVLGLTPLSRLELPLLTAARQETRADARTASDAFVLDAIANPLWRGGLMIEYAVLGDRAEQHPAPRAAAHAVRRRRRWLGRAYRLACLAGMCCL